MLWAHHSACHGHPLSGGFAEHDNDEVRLVSPALGPSRPALGLSFTPAELADAIRVHIPDFTMTFEPDFRQEIADTWPRVIDDSRAQEDWDWKPDYDIHMMTKEMLDALRDSPLLASAA